MRKSCIEKYRAMLCGIYLEWVFGSIPRTIRSEKGRLFRIESRTIIRRRGRKRLIPILMRVTINSAYAYSTLIGLHRIPLIKTSKLFWSTLTIALTDSKQKFSIDALLGNARTVYICIGNCSQYQYCNCSRLIELVFEIQVSQHYQPCRAHLDESIWNFSTLPKEMGQSNVIEVGKLLLLHVELLDGFARTIREPVPETMLWRNWKCWGSGNWKVLEWEALANIWR
uniref:Uncharacterized protein n=1 Tax=Glossina morsitans morsitans TaxID=37546 RepID=A0A1B0GB63_GLOMM